MNKTTSKYIENAVEQLTSLPGIGRQTAMRMVLNLLKRSKEEVNMFAHAFIEMKQEVHYCSSCGNISDLSLCMICANPLRDHATICVVEDIRDVMAIEATQTYNGIYHVLGGIVSPMDGIAPSDLNIESLIKKVSEQPIQEVIFALSVTMEGDTTCFFIHKKIEALPIKVTALSRGVAIGTELQYTDGHTLGRSIVNRQPFEVWSNSN